MKVLLCFSGSVATIAASSIVHALIAEVPALELIAVVTDRASHFLERRDGTESTPAASTSSSSTEAAPTAPTSSSSSSLASTGGKSSVEVQFCKQVVFPPSDSFALAPTATMNNGAALAPPAVLTVPYYDDEAEWLLWNRRGDTVLHIKLAQWADVVLVAPLSAHMLARVANGLADNLATCILRALPFGSLAAAPGVAVGSRTEKNETLVVKSTAARIGLVLCPAMNTRMWEHPITQTHLNVIQQQFHVSQPGNTSSRSSDAAVVVQVVPPVRKVLACGDDGVGALASPASIATAVQAVGRTVAATHALIASKL